MKYQFQRFCEENPFGFEREQLEKIENDILNPRGGSVCDEYVDFILWTKGLKSRQEAFAEFVERLFPREQYQNLLEVGSGRCAGLSRLLSEKGYKVTAMDPKIVPDNVRADDVICIKEAFAYGKTNITKFDAVVAQEPCEATEHIIRECIERKKDFVISLCGAPHALMNGEMPEDVYAWYRYLEEIDRENCMLVKPKLIPGYLSYVMIGKFT